MRLLIARCTVDYSGRLDAHLPEATRLIMLKADGCVAIHADGGAYKPLNWMTAPNRLNESEGQWEVVNPAGERLIITLHEVLHDSDHELGTDPGLVKDGVEKHLQELLADHPGTIEEGLILVRREHPTDIGPVDLLCRDTKGQPVAVEIKRKGEIDGIEQLTRYLHRIRQDPALTNVRGILAAQAIKPQARALAASRDIGCATIDYDALRGLEPAERRLF